MILKTLILLLATSSFTSSQQMTCTYSIGSSFDNYRYKCLLSVDNPDGLDDAVSIGGVHLGSGSYMDDYGNLISTSIYNDSSVQVLQVVGNTKNIPSAICRQFPNVEELSFYMAKLQIVSATKCSKLTALRFSYNSIEASTLVDLCQFQPALKIIHLNNNNLNALPDITLKSCKNLVEFNVNGNKISAISSTLFASTPTIEWIRISGNPISVIPNGIFNGLTELKMLDMNNLLITEMPINIFSTATNLRSLTLENNKFTQYRPEWFQNLKNLTGLSLNNNKAPIPANFFQPMPLLQTVFLENCNISVVYPQWFSSLTSLQILRLQRNIFNVIPDNTFSNTKALVDLDISGNKLTIISSKWFTSAVLQNIREITADNNQVDAIDPLFFQQSTSLWDFSLSNNKCYNGPRITDFSTKRSTYMPGFQTCIDNFAAIQYL